MLMVELSVLFTFYQLLTMFQSGLKQSPLGLIILKLLQILSGPIFFLHVWSTRAIISKQGSHFCNNTIKAFLRKYELCTRSLLHITPKLMGKLGSQIGKLSIFWRKKGATIQEGLEPLSRIRILLSLCHFENL